MAANCYLSYNGSSTPTKYTHWGPCAVSDTSEGVSCCNNGDVCLSNGMCKFGEGMVGIERGASGIYMAGCTDSTYASSACNHNCSAYANADVTFDWFNNVWRCCGLGPDGIRNCSMPQGVPMHGPNPANLKPTATVIAEGNFQFLSQATPIDGPEGNKTSLVSSGAAAMTALPGNINNMNTNSVTPTAAAGIGVGATIGVEAVLAFGIWLIWRWRARSRPSAATPVYRGRSPQGYIDPSWHEVEGSDSEKPSHHELGPGQTLRLPELSARSNR